MLSWQGVCLPDTLDKAGLVCFALAGFSKGKRVIFSFALAMWSFFNWQVEKWLGFIF
jgi:hypothetical protein